MPKVQEISHMTPNGNLKNVETEKISDKGNKSTS